MPARAPDFWWEPRRGMQALALAPLSALWGTGATMRMRRAPSFRPSVPVICVGNFVVGGAGKTPTAIALARAARDLGLKPGILSKGYGGSVSEPIRVDPGRHASSEVGDEPLLLAVAAPTVVAPDRPAGARRLLDEGVTLILMDDGFQDPKLARDLSLMVVDSGAGIGNGMVLPAGPLRAPLGVQLALADAVLMVGDGTAGEEVRRAAAVQGCEVLNAAIRPVRDREGHTAAVFAFAGIGRPEKFFDTLREAGIEVAASRAFPDHHVFQPADARALLADADRRGLRLVTTEKDHVRLARGEGALARLGEAAEPFPVHLEFEDRAAIVGLIETAVRRHAEG